MKITANVLIGVASFLLIAILAAPLNGAHTFHASLMQVEYNQKEQLAEISINVFSDDLERALSRRSGKSVRLDKSLETARLVLAYLNDSVHLKNIDGRIQGLTWVGMEPKADSVWLYVETKVPSGFEGMEVSNRLFFDLFNDQVNRVHIKYEDKKYDLVFKPGDEFKPFETKPRK